MAFDIKNGVLKKYAENTVNIPDGVTKIGKNAFEKSMITKIVMSDNVAEIEKKAFSYCIELQEAKLSENLKSIGECAFQHCIELKKIHNYDSVCEIGENAFKGCSTLAEFKITKALNKISGNAFSGCETLKFTGENQKYKSIENGIVDKRNNTLICGIGNIVDKSIEVVGKNAFCYCDEVESMDFPKLKIIGSFAFSHSSIRDVKFPNSVSIIGKKAFYSCYKLSDLYISDSVNAIGDGAFQYCYNLKK